MRHFIFLSIYVFSSAAFTQQLELDFGNPSDKEIIAPVLLKSNNTDETHIGVITTEHTRQNPDALSILRQELNRQAAIEQAKVKKDGVFISVTKGFTPVSITFFIAIGLVTYNSMWISSHGDPLAMERHILSLKDPIAHLSFYAFMQTQGFYMDFRSKRPGFSSMDPVTKRQLMTRLSYQGIALGSLAASIVADLGQSAKMCVEQWLKGKTDEASLASCNQAWAQWTVRSKFTQYFPQIISLWAGQALSTAIERGAVRGFNKATQTTFMQKFLNKDSLVKYAYKITGADVTLTFFGGGWVTKSIKLVGKLTRFTVFVGADHFLMNYTYRPLNNLVRPLFFDFDAIKINKLWLVADKNNWELSKIVNSKTVKTTALEKFEKEIENYGSQMQQWREHLNSDAEADLAGWLEMTKKILNQVDYAYKYYGGFTSYLFETLNTQHKIKNQQLDPSAKEVISGYPMRTLPFYGVLTGPYKPIGGKIEDYYLLSPNELEKRQKEHVLNTAKKYQIEAHGLKGFELKEYNTLMEKLLSQDNLRMSSGLNDLNQLNKNEIRFDRVTGQAENVSIYSLKFQDLVYRLKKELGNPQPIIYPLAGYSQAIAANSIVNATAQAADYSKWSVYNKYRFNKEADLMLYKLICGQSKASLYRVKALGANLLSPQFNPPSLLNSNNDKEREVFCQSKKTTGNLYSTKIGNLSLKDHILANFNYGAMGDFRNENTKPTEFFNNWWLETAKQPMNAEFRNFDLQYKKIVKLSYNNYFDHRSNFKLVVDSLNQSWYLPKSIDASIKAESRVYLQMLSRILTADNAPMPKHESLLFSQLPRSKTITFVNYLEFATRTSGQLNYVPLYENIPPEIERLNNLLEAYPAYIKQTDINFDQYIAHSKKIDTTINDVLVLVGFKKLLQQSTSADDLSANLSASATGNENSDKIYQDISVPSPTYKQRMAIAAVKGLRQVESEIRRFIRMKIVLSQSLELDAEEFMSDWNNSNPAQLESSKAKKIGPFNP